MDKKYDEAAEHYGFNCSGCSDSCCMTHFYHHTFLEYFYIIKEYSLLPYETRKKIAEKAEIASEKADRLQKNGKRPRIMCPLNFDGLCLIYGGRPMICRLHGIPHEINLGSRIKSPGCQSFDIQNRDGKYFIFDRAKIYIKMARLENRMKKELKISEKIKMTAAQMIIRYEKHSISEKKFLGRF